MQHRNLSPSVQLRVEILEGRHVPSVMLLPIPGIEELSGLDVLSDGTIQVVGYGPMIESNPFGTGTFVELNPSGTVTRSAVLRGTSDNARPEVTFPEAVSNGRIVGSQGFFLANDPNSYFPSALVWRADLPEDPIPVEAVTSGHFSILHDINSAGINVGGYTYGTDPLGIDNTARVGSFGEPARILEGPWYDSLDDRVRDVEPFARAISDDNNVVISSGQGPPLHPGLNGGYTTIQSWVFNIETMDYVQLSNPAAATDVDFLVARSISPNGQFVAGGAGVFDFLGAETVLYQPVLFSGPGWNTAELITYADGQPFFMQAAVLGGSNVQVVVSDDGILFSDSWNDIGVWVKAPGRPLMNLTDYLQATFQMNAMVTFNRVTDVVSHEGRNYIGVNTEQGAQILIIDQLPGDHPPVPVDHDYVLNEDRQFSSDLLDGATDPDNDMLVVVSATIPAHGTLLWNADGTFTYSPNANYHGPDGFDYSVSDSIFEVEAHVSFDVAPDDDSPIAMDDSAAGDNGQTISGNLLANDSDIDGDSLQVSAHTDPAHGQVDVSNDGTFNYDAATNFVGTDTFMYTIDDGHGGTASATVMIIIDPRTTFTGTLRADKLVVDLSRYQQASQITIDTSGGVDSVTVVGRASHPIGILIRTGDGNDKVTIEAVGEVTVQAELGAGNDRYVAMDSTAMSIVHGGDGNDKITGSSLFDMLFGELGNDVLKGLGGGDTLDGGPGRNKIIP